MAVTRVFYRESGRSLDSPSTLKVLLSFPSSHSYICPMYLNFFLLPSLLQNWRLRGVLKRPANLPHSRMEIELWSTKTYDITSTFVSSHWMRQKSSLEAGAVQIPHPAAPWPSPPSTSEPRRRPVLRARRPR